MIRINLVPKDERGKSQRKVDWSRMAAIMLVSLAVVVVAFGVYNSVLVGMYETKLDGMTADMTLLRSRELELRNIKQENTTVQKDIQAAKSFSGQQANERLLATLRGLAEATPADVWFDQLYVSADQSITASGLAYRSADLAQLLENVRAVPAVTGIEVPTIIKLGEGSTAMQSFSMRLKLGGGQ